MKMVTFKHREGLEYNLGFGDIIRGRISDSVISNNEDLIKVMNTVAETIYMFLEKYPSRKIYMQAVDIDTKRSKLYHIIFRRRLSEIKQNFRLEGMIKVNEWEVFNPEKEYIAFRLSKK